MRVLLTLQYLGTNYAGWQSQTNAIGIQNVVEKALSTMFGGPIRIEGAGRTDAGVHARAQRAHVDIPFAIEPRGFRQGLNNLLPHDIRVAAVETVADDFHCRFAAKSKTYVYQIWNAEIADVFADPTYAHVPQPLDAGRMRTAAQALLGQHDFALFTVAGPEVSSTERTITSIDVTRDGAAITISVTADGFLRSMVRRIAGSLIEIGRGKMEPDAIWTEARWTAPAKGLMLWEVGY
ncbi:MAG TPA: tRNA pseudouridine(38-40) synthase TruA [Thermoanaerobaculia bacterium]|nr:tRNA pseudouridine(38-40) synthase TruA [Thermoanaerobaculia bacterium]